MSTAYCPDFSLHTADGKVRQYTDIQVADATPQPPTHVVETLQGIHDQVGKLVQRPLLHAATPIDGRNAMIRSQETNMGNMLADAVRAFYDADIGFFNSGAVRSDCILGAADLDGEPLLVRDIISKPNLACN